MKVMEPANRKLHGHRWVALFMCVLLCSSLTIAQAVSGDIVGRVVDASGAVVPNATITATNNSTHQTQSTTTNANGEYRFPNLPVGHYKLSVSGSGLAGQLGDVRVDLQRIATANITATVGSSTTTVEVVEQAASIDTTTSNVATTYEMKQAQDLPTASFGAGVLNLSLLQAGVASSGGVGAGTGPSVSGQRPRNNNYMIEGVDNNDKSVTGPLLTIPNDAVSNFSVLQNNFSPEFGHSSGGQFNQVVLSGTNNWHGRLYEYFQNRKLNGQDAVVARSQRSSIDPATGNPLAVENTRYDNNRFGGQIGGPIIKDKLFFFHNSEYNPNGFSLSSTGCAPTAAGYAALDAQAAAGTLSSNNLSIMKQYIPAATRVASPDPNDPCFQSASVNGITIPTGDVGFNGNGFTNAFTTVNSVDYNLAAADQFRFRYIFGRTTTTDFGAQNPVFWTGEPIRNHVVTLSEFHTFSPKITNEARIGFNRYWFTNIIPTQQFPGLAEFPNITINELNGVNIGPSPNAPQFGSQNTYQLTDNVTWLAGKHNLKLGMEYRKYISPSHFIQRERGDYYWNTLEGYLQDVSPDFFAERSTGTANYSADQYALYGYGNDEWRMTTHLTLNLGLRYEFTSVTSGVKMQALNSAASVPGLVNFGAPSTQKTNFAPRVGFAYSPGTSGNTSIRGGYAMAYDVLYDNLGSLSLPPQLSATCDVGTQQTSFCFWNNNAFLASGGLPQNPPVFSSVLEQRQATSSFVPNQKLPYSEAWNFGVQHIFGKKYIAEVRYVGTRGIHLPVQSRLNIQNVVTPTHFLPTFVDAPSQSQLDALTVSQGQLINEFLNGGNYVPSWNNAGFNGANVIGFMPYGKSLYHGLQTQLTRNFTNGLQFQLAWTWSHLWDNSTADVFTTVLTPRRPQDFQNVNADMSTSALDRRHRVTLSLIYDVPFFKKDSNWFVKNVVGNWEIAPIYTFQSPEYATVEAGWDANLNGDSAGDRAIINPKGIPGTASTVSPLCSSALPAGVTCGGTGSSNYIVAYQADDPKAYYLEAQYGALSTAARNSLPLPRTNNWDLTLVKRINLTEKSAIELQAQALNVLNHAQYVPGSLNQVTSIGYTSGEARSFLTPGQTNFNQPQTVFSNQPRAMQLALKFTF